MRWPVTRASPPALRDVARAPAILLIGGNPTEEHPLLAWNLRTNVRLNKARLYVANATPIKLERQAKADLRLPANGYPALADYLSGKATSLGNAAFRDALLAEESLLVILGEEYRGAQIAALVDWGLQKGNVRFAYLGDHANSRGAADMGLLPDLLPGYVPVNAPGGFAAEYAGMPAAPGKTQPEMFAAAAKGVSAHCWWSVRIRWRNLNIDPTILRKTFVVVQDIFLTETAALADVVFPAASLYEKTGTVTNTFGDVQLARKAADHAGVKSDFEILVRLAGAMGVDVKTLVPSAKAESRQIWPVTRGAIRRSGSSRGVARGEWVGAKTKPIRSPCGAG